jgi:hypothetical protein
MNKVKILDYAYLAEGVYYPAWKNGHKSKHTSFLNKYSWVLAQDVDTDKKFGNPFFARLYLHLNGQQQVTAAVVAYRGTVPFSHFDNDRSDFRIATEDKYPLGYARAVIFYQHARRYVQAHYPGVRVTVTGHWGAPWRSLWRFTFKHMQWSSTHPVWVSCRTYTLIS